MRKELSFLAAVLVAAVVAGCGGSDGGTGESGGDGGSGQGALRPEEIRSTIDRVCGASRVLALAGCRDRTPPGCRVVSAQRLPPSALTLAPEVTLVTAGDAFVLVAVQGDELRWAHLDSDGVVGTVSTLALPSPRAIRPEPWFAVVGKDAPAEQLVVVTVSTRGEVVAIAQNVGGAPSAPKKLFDIPAGFDPNTTRISMGSSRTGRRAVLVVGYDGQQASPMVYILKSDGEVHGMPFPAYRQVPFVRWSCLSVITSRNDLAVSVLEQERTGRPMPRWHSFEFNDEGSRGTEYVLSLGVDKLDCPQVSPTARGYVLAYQNEDAVYLSDFDAVHTVLNSSIVMGALRLGGAEKAPKVACVAPMGQQFGLLFDRSSGHQLWRIDAFGRLQGAPLRLHATAGIVGTVSALPRTDAIYATYLDQVPAGSDPRADGGSPGNQRYFLRVDCPVTPPSAGP